VAQDLVTYRHSGVRGVKVPRHFTSRNPEPQNADKRPSSYQVTSSEPENERGPLLSRECYLGHLKDTRHASVPFRHSGVRGVKVLCLRTSKPRTPTASKTPKLGPATSRSIFSRPSKGNTWQQIGPSRRFAHRDSKAQKAAPLCSDARDAGRVPGPDPQQRRVNLGPSVFKDAWRPFELSRQFAHRDFEEERSCSFLTRDPRSADSALKLNSGSQPMVTREERSCA
jgi:hypothetical protein